MLLYYTFISITLCVFLVQSHKVGLLLNDDESEEAAAIERVVDYTMSKFDGATDLQLEIQHHDATYLSLMKAICLLVNANVVAVISASDSTLTDIQHNLLTQFRIPSIAAVATNPFMASSNSDDLQLMLTPSDVYQSRAIFDLLKEYNWLEFTILASADDYGINGVVYLQYLASQDGNFNIRDVQHFDVRKDTTKPMDQKLFSEELQLIKDSLTKVIVLNCGGGFAKRIFKEAEDLGLMDKSFVWITTEGITARPESIAYTDNSYPSFYIGIIGTLPIYGTVQLTRLEDEYLLSGRDKSDFRMSSVKVYEGLKIVHAALSKLDEGNWDNLPVVQCDSKNTDNSWSGGKILFEKMDQLFRSSTAPYLTYDVMNFQSNGFQKVGIWGNTSGLLSKESEKLTWSERRDIIYIGGDLSPPTGFGNSLTGYHLRIGIVPEPPIAFKKDTCVEDTSSPDCWFGWNPDIVAQLAKDLNFTYEYVMPADKKYGGFNKETKKWNGMIKDLLDRKIDLTIALSINTERSEYIDFTASFFEDQASFIVYVKSSMSSSNIFFFLEPFKMTVWVTIIGLIVVIALITSFFSKLSPFGSYGRRIHAMQTCTCTDCSIRRENKQKNKCGFADTKTYHCLLDKAESDDDLDDLNVFNSTWLIGTGFVLQGTDTLPVAPSGRFLLFIWWLFIMILTSMYTANLTAHLTLERASITIGGLDDILEQNEYKWGLITDRNLESMMKNHEDEKYRNLVNRGIKLQNLDEGIEKVNEGGFVFIDESSVLTFNFKDECQALQTNTGKFNNQWAFGIQTNSPYATVINNMFLQYREKGWFTGKFEEWYSGASEVSCTTSVGSNTKFDLSILSGLFLILAVGAMISFILVFIEILYVSCQDSRRCTAGFCACLWKRVHLISRAIAGEWFRRPRTKIHTNGNKNNTIEPMYCLPNVQDV